MPDPIEATPIVTDGDTWIRETTPTTNYSTNNNNKIAVTSGKAVDEFRSLIHFDLSSFLATRSHELISKVELFIHGGPVGLGTQPTPSIFKCTQAFVASEATWNEYSSGNSWTTAGGDYDGAYEYPITPVAADILIDITPLVMDLLKAGETDLYLILIDDTATTSGWTIMSLENVTVAERPDLRISYLDGGRRRKGSSVRV